MIILLNDVDSQYDNKGVLVGDKDALITDEGVRQSSIISRYIVKKYPRPKNVVFSDLVRLKQLIHHLRLDLRGSTFRSSNALRERNFGVLTGSVPRPESEIFIQSRICPEGGESVSQCRSRAMGVINHYDEKFVSEVNILISHPYLCQIMANAMENKDITLIEDFWFKKGSMAVFETSPYFKLKETVNILEISN